MRAYLSLNGCLQFYITGWWELIRGDLAVYLQVIKQIDELKSSDTLHEPVELGLNSLLEPLDSLLLNIS